MTLTLDDQLFLCLVTCGPPAQNHFLMPKELAQKIKEQNSEFDSRFYIEEDSSIHERFCWLWYLDGWQAEYACRARLKAADELEKTQELVVVPTRKLKSKKQHITNAQQQDVVYQAFMKGLFK